MANTLQRLIYNFSATSPLFLMLGLVYLLQKKNLFYFCVCFIIVCVFCIYIFWLFLYCKKNLPPISIRTTNITPKDDRIILYLIPYILPFTCLIIDTFNIIICGIICCIVIIIIAYININIPNPILLCLGYHFYDINAENGVSGYTVISRRNLRKNADLQYIYRIFEFMLLDVEE